MGDKRSVDKVLLLSRACWGRKVNSSGPGLTPLLSVGLDSGFRVAIGHPCWHRLTGIDLPSSSPALALHADMEGARNGLSRSEVGAGGFGHH